MSPTVIAREIAEIGQRVDRVRALLPSSAQASRRQRTAAEALILSLCLALQGAADLAMHGVATPGPGRSGRCTGRLPAPGRCGDSRRHPDRAPRGLGGPARPHRARARQSRSRSRRPGGARRLERAGDPQRGLGGPLREYGDAPRAPMRRAGKARRRVMAGGYGEEEQRSQRGCSGGRMPPYLRSGPPGDGLRSLSEHHASPAIARFADVAEPWVLTPARPRPENAPGSPADPAREPPRRPQRAALCSGC